MDSKALPYYSEEELEDLQSLLKIRYEFAFETKQPINDVLNMSIEDFIMAQNIWNEYITKKNNNTGGETC